MLNFNHDSPNEETLATVNLARIAQEGEYEIALINLNRSHAGKSTDIETKFVGHAVWKACFNVADS